MLQEPGQRWGNEMRDGFEEEPVDVGTETVSVIIYVDGEDVEDGDGDVLGFGIG